MIKSQKNTNGALKDKHLHIDLKQGAAQEVDCVKTETGIPPRLAASQEPKVTHLN